MINVKIKIASACAIATLLFPAISAHALTRDEALVNQKLVLDALNSAKTTISTLTVPSKTTQYTDAEMRDYYSRLAKVNSIYKDAKVKEKSTIVSPQILTAENAMNYSYLEFYKSEVVAVNKYDTVDPKTLSTQSLALRLEMMDSIINNSTDVATMVSPISGDLAKTILLKDTLINGVANTVIANAKGNLLTLSNLEKSAADLWAVQLILDRHALTASYYPTLYGTVKSLATSVNTSYSTLTLNLDNTILNYNKSYTDTGARLTFLNDLVNKLNTYPTNIKSTEKFTKFYKAVTYEQKALKDLNDVTNYYANPATVGPLGIVNWLNPTLANAFVMDNYLTAKASMRTAIYARITNILDKKIAELNGRASTLSPDLNTTYVNNIFNLVTTVAPLMSRGDLMDKAQITQTRALGVIKIDTQVRADLAYVVNNNLNLLDQTARTAYVDKLKEISNMLGCLPYPELSSKYAPLVDTVNNAVKTDIVNVINATLKCDGVPATKLMYTLAYRYNALKAALGQMYGTANPRYTESILILDSIFKSTISPAINTITTDMNNIYRMNANTLVSSMASTGKIDTTLLTKFVNVDYLNAITSPIPANPCQDTINNGINQIEQSVVISNINYILDNITVAPISLQMKLNLVRDIYSYFNSMSVNNNVTLVFKNIAVERIGAALSGLSGM